MRTFVEFRDSEQDNATYIFAETIVNHLQVIVSLNPVIGTIRTAVRLIQLLG